MRESGLSLTKWILILAAIILCAGFYLYSEGLLEGYINKFSAQNTAAVKDTDRKYRVTRKSFNVRIKLDGVLDAIENHDIRCMIRRGEAKIAWVIESGTTVKKDDILFQFVDVKHLTDETNRIFEINEAENQLRISQEDLKIRKADAMADIKSSIENLRTAQQELKKYLELESPNQRRDLDNAIDDAETNLLSEERKLSDKMKELTSAESDDDIAKIEAALVTLRASRDKAQIEYEKAMQKKRVFRQYDQPQQERTKRANVTRAELGLKKSEVNAKSQIAQANLRIFNNENKLRNLKDDLKELQTDIKNLVIRAPADGVVTLGNRNRRPWEQPKEYKEGTTASYQEPIAFIPDTRAFAIIVDFPENRRSVVNVGHPVVCTSPVMPDLRLQGEVIDISINSEPRDRGDPSSPRFYKVRISADSSDCDSLITGQSVEVEIIVDEVKDALHVPVESVYNKEGKTYCKVWNNNTPEEREVQVGRRSDDYVEILSGLEEGDEVMLYPTIKVS